MAAIKTTCPHCLSQYDVGEEQVGTAIRCTRCQNPFIIAPSGPPPAPAEIPAVAAPVQAPVKIRLKPGTVNVMPVRPAAPPAPPPPSPNAPLVVKDIGLEFLPVRPGIFRQGSDRGYLTEKPEHQTRLTRPFWIGRFPVTQMQYWLLTRKCPSYFIGEHLPVETVSWMDALEFCRRLTERERVGGRIPSSVYFRLPTEAEWEYCCRAPAAGAPDFGTDDDAASLAQYAWFEGNSGGMTHQVGTVAPNRLGLYDMLGNVAEWCMDWYAPYTAEEAVDPAGPANGNRRVRRGGGWSSTARRCRASDRVGVSPDCRSALIGFRMVAVDGGTPPYALDYRML